MTCNNTWVPWLSPTRLKPRLTQRGTYISSYLGRANRKEGDGQKKGGNYKQQLRFTKKAAFWSSVYNPSTNLQLLVYPKLILLSWFGVCYLKDFWDKCTPMCFRAANQSTPTTITLLFHTRNFFAVPLKWNVFLLTTADLPSVCVQTAEKYEYHKLKRLNLEY